MDSKRSSSDNLTDTYSNWPGPQSTVIAMVGQGFRYTGKDCIFKCSDCKSTVNMMAKNVIKVSDEHKSGCKILNFLRQTKMAPSDTETESNFLQRERQVDAPTQKGQISQDKQRSENSEQNEDFTVSSVLDDTLKQDLRIYTTYDSIKYAPCSLCPCQYCNTNQELYQEKFRRYDVYGRKRCNLDNFLKLTLTPRLAVGPLHPGFLTTDKRRKSFECQCLENSNNILRANAGFYNAGEENGRICCFYCDGGLEEALLNYNPWREHARWFPLCPHVRKEKGDKYIHDVINDTKRLKRYFEDINRNYCMDTNVVMAAIKQYPPAIVKDVIEQLFFDNNGSFPGREQLFQTLETVKLFKTSENYDYCGVD